jgi:hypothetical protein
MSATANPSRCDVCRRKLGDKRRALGITQCPSHTAAMLPRLMGAGTVSHPPHPSLPISALPSPKVLFDFIGDSPLPRLVPHFASSPIAIPRPCCTVIVIIYPGVALVAAALGPAVSEPRLWVCRRRWKTCTLVEHFAACTMRCSRGHLLHVARWMRYLSKP